MFSMKQLVTYDAPKVTTCWAVEAQIRQNIQLRGLSTHETPSGDWSDSSYLTAVIILFD